ncbi:hypothetical protein R3I94_012457 [Phoxinus phoxinus]
MAHRSQCSSSGDNPLDPNYLAPHYREEYRMAIDALVDADLDGYYGFLQEVDVVDFLSRSEIEYIRCMVLAPHQTTQLERRCMAEDVDGSSDTYWPVHSDHDAPNLDLGWPQPYRSFGPTEVTTLVNPSDPKMPSIKEQVRRMIKTAQEVIAVVMDMFTDVDIFADILGAATRGVAVYILLDEMNAQHFVSMVNSCRVNLDEIKFMRVRTVSGSTYSCRSGKTFKGQMMDRFILVDCRAVLSGNYSFMWSFEKIHRCLAHLFFGQLVTTFDEEFRILYAHSEPLIVEKVLANMPHYDGEPEGYYNTEKTHMFNRQYPTMGMEWAERTGEDHMKVGQKMLPFRSESIHSAAEANPSVQRHVNLHADQPYRGDHQSIEHGRQMRGPTEMVGFKRNSYGNIPDYEYLPPQNIPIMRGKQYMEGAGLQGSHFAREPHIYQGAEFQSGYDMYGKLRGQGHHIDQFTGSGYPHEGDEAEPTGAYDHVQRYLQSQSGMEEGHGPRNVLSPVQSNIKRHNMGQSYTCQSSPKQPNLPEQKRFFNVNHKPQDVSQKQGMRDWRISSYLSAYDDAGELDLAELEGSSTCGDVPCFTQEAPCGPVRPEIRPGNREFNRIPSPRENPLFVQIQNNYIVPDSSVNHPTNLSQINIKTTPTSTSESSCTTEGDKVEETQNREPKETKRINEDFLKKKSSRPFQRSSRLRHSLIFSSNLELHTSDEMKDTLGEKDGDEASKPLARVSHILDKRRTSSPFQPFQWSDFVKSNTFDNSDIESAQPEDKLNKLGENSDLDKVENSQNLCPLQEKDLLQTAVPERKSQRDECPSNLLQKSSSFIDMNDPDCRLRYFKELAAKRKLAAAAKVSQSNPVKATQKFALSEKPSTNDADKNAGPFFKTPDTAPKSKNTTVPAPEIKENCKDTKFEESSKDIMHRATDAEKIRFKKKLAEESGSTFKKNQKDTDPTLKPVEEVRTVSIAKNQTSPILKIFAQKPSCALSGKSSDPSQHPTATETDFSQQPTATITDPSQQPTVIVTDSSQHPTATETNSSQHPTATITDPSQQPTITVTEPSQHPTVTETNSSQHPTITVTEPSQHPTVTETNSSQRPNVTVTEPSQHPTATITDPSQHPTATVTGPSQHPTATITDPSQQPTITVTEPSQHPTVTETNSSQHPTITVTEPSQHPTVTETNSSQRPNVTVTEPSQHPTATITDPSQHPTATVTGPSQHPTATVTGPSQHPTVTETNSSQQPTATITDPSQHPTSTVTGPSQHPTATVTEPSQHPTATETNSSQHPTATITDSSQHPTATMTDSSQHPTATITDPSQQPTATITDSSQHPTATETNSSQHPTATITDSSQHPTATMTDSSQHPTATITDPSQQPTATITDFSQQPTAIITDSSQQPTATITDSSQHPTATVTDSSQHPTATVTDYSQYPTATVTDSPQHHSATITDSSQQPTATITDPSQHPTATITDSSQHPTATETNSSQHPTATETNSSQHPTATVTEPSQHPTATVTDSPQHPTVTETDSSQHPTATIADSSQQPTATITDSSQHPTVTVTDSSQHPTAIITDSSQQPTATVTDSSQHPTATESDSSQHPTETIKDSSQHPTATESDSSQHPTEIITDSSQHPTATVTEPSQHPTATVTDSSQHPTATVTDSSQHPTATVTDSSQLPTATESDSSQHPTETITDSSQHPTETITDSSQHPTLTIADPSKHPTATITDSSQHPTATITDSSQHPTATITDSSQHPSATITDPSQHPTATITDSSQHPTATITDSSKHPTATITDSSQHPTATITDSSQHPTATITDPSQHPTATITDSSQHPTATITDPSQHPTATITDSSQHPTATITDPSQHPTATITDSSQQPTETETNSSQHPTATLTDSSQHPTATITDSSQQPTETETNSSQHPTATITDYSQHPTATITDPSQHPTATLTDSSQHPTATITDSSQQPTETETNSSQHPTATITDYSQHPTATITDPSQHPTATITDYSQHPTATITDSSQQPTATVTEPSQHPTATETNSSQHPTATITDSSQYPTATFTEPSQHPTATITDSSQHPTPTITDSSQYPTATITDSSQHPTPTITDSSQHPTATETDSSQHPSATETDSSQHPTATETDSSQHPSATVTDYLHQPIPKADTVPPCDSQVELNQTQAWTKPCITPMVKDTDSDALTSLSLVEVSSSQPQDLSELCLYSNEINSTQRITQLQSSISSNPMETIAEQSQRHDSSAIAEGPNMTQTEVSTALDSKQTTPEVENSVTNFAEVSEKSDLTVQSNSENQSSAAKNPKSIISAHQLSTANVISCSNLRDDTKVLLEQISAKNQSRSSQSKQTLAAPNEAKEGEVSSADKLFSNYSGRHWSSKTTPEERDMLIQNIEKKRKERKVYSRFEAS